jgi:hypothetical protein
LVQFALLIFVSLAVIFATTQTVAASTAIEDLNSIQVTPTPTPTPSVTTPTIRPDIEMLLKTLMTQELPSVDREVLTTGLERLLDELAEGQSQISVEYEDDNEEEKALTITITPIDLNAPVEEEAETEEDTDNGDNGDIGEDEPPEEPTSPIDIPAPPF